ncbi:hypothetical protein JCM6882_001081 [Rhodosporidiobolus microsporus]
MLRLLRPTPYRSSFRRTFSSPSPSPPSTSPPSPSARSRLAPYLSQLHARYPHTSPASLTASFLLLHEFTALVPLVALFGAFSFLGVGAGVVGWTVDETAQEEEREGGGGWKGTVRGWLEEAEDKAERVGRRYGLFGWEKESAEDRKERRVREAQEKEQQGGEVLKKERDLRVSGEVANAVAAYLAVKALLPLRILVSLRLAPTLANGLVGRWKMWRATAGGVAR